MSTRSRARRIQKEVPHLNYQQIIQDLERLRIKPKHDELYIAAHQARNYSELTCSECGEKYPVGYDKKGLQTTQVDEYYCPACFDDRGQTFCSRCARPVPGQDENYCPECDSYMDYVMSKDD